MTTFVEYRDGAGGKIAKLILGKSITKLTSWNEFKDFVYHVGNTSTGGRKIMDRAEKAYGEGHVGERAVILATLFAMDRSTHAILLQYKGTENLLGIMNYVDGPHSRAVAACLVMED